MILITVRGPNKSGKSAVASLIKKLFQNLDCDSYSVDESNLELEISQAIIKQLKPQILIETFNQTKLERANECQLPKRL